MDRRGLLRGAAGLLAGVGLAGCTGSQGDVPVTAEPPPPGVRSDRASGEGASEDGGVGPSTANRTVVIEDFDAIEADDGSLVVSVTVSNDSGQRQVRLVRATVTVENVETVAERFVAVEGGGTATVRLPVDVGYRAWLNGGSYVPELLDRTPATPLPTATPTPVEPTTRMEGSPTATPEADTRSETGNGTGTATPSATTTDASTVTAGSE